jgi:two-component system cell cycle sensor histidine kinase/response regulator CckA
VGETIRVLIVEDLPTDAELSEREIRKALGACEFRRVETREAFLAAIDEYGPELIVSDFKMPQFDGLAALKLALERCPDVPFIMVTGSMNEDTAVECMKAGAWDYVIKEHVKRLGAAVRAALERQRVRLERQRALAALTASEALTRGILENVQDAYVRVDLDGRILMVSPSAVGLYGYGSMEEMIGLPTTALYATQEERPRVLEELKLHGSLRDIVGQGRKKDGTIFWVSLNARFFKNEQGKVAGAECFARDISEREQVADRLRASEERYKQLVDNTDTGFVVIDEQGIVVSANEPYVRLAGAKRMEDVVGHSVTEWTAPDQRENNARAVALCARQGSIQDFETVYQHADGTRVEVTINATVEETAEGGKRLASLCRDITARKRAEAERENLEQQLRLSQRLESIGSLAGGIAHDFNNLLSVILCCTDFALGRVTDDDRARDELLEVKKAGERAVALTRQLLAFSRKQVLQPVVLDLNQIAAGVEKMLRRILGEDIDYVQVLAPDLGVVRADPGQIEQVLMNLVVNARDAMPTGGKLTIETCNVDLDEEYAARHVATKPGAYVRLVVSDTGCGMDAATQARVFEPFFTTKEKGKGTGLGLSTVYGIVKQSGGNIWVYSEPGQGTTFKIYLPRVFSAEKTVTGSRLAAVPDRATGTETILVVDDEKAIRHIAKGILGAAGYTVLTAAAASNALLTSKAHQGKIHLLLTDVVMPHVSGRALAESLAVARPGIKVLYMSGYTDDAIVHHGTLDPGTHFIGKPFSGADLTKKVREVLDSGMTKPADGHEQAIGVDAETKEQSPDGGALRTLSPDTRNRLREAVLAARYDEIVVLIENVRITHPNLATELRRMADLFDYDGMRAFLD